MNSCNPVRRGPWKLPVLLHLEDTWTQFPPTLRLRRRDCVLSPTVVALVTRPHPPRPLHKPNDSRTPPFGRFSSHGLFGASVADTRCLTAASFVPRASHQPRRHFAPPPRPPLCPYVMYICAALLSGHRERGEVGKQDRWAWSATRNRRQSAGIQPYCGGKQRAAVDRR